MDLFTPTLTQWNIGCHWALTYILIREMMANNKQRQTHRDTNKEENKT